MKLEDINETVFQALSPEVQQTLIEVGRTPAPAVVGIVVIAIIVLFLALLLID